MKKISPAQKIQFKLLRMTHFNAFDGKPVAESLEKNDDLWEGFVFGRFSCCPLLVLRDIMVFDDEIGGWNGSELYIIPIKGKERELIDLAKTWQPDELNYEKGKEIDMMMGGSDYGKILRAWWD